VSEILVVGSLGYDSVQTPRGCVENVLGGSANYFSFAASPFAKISLVGVVGSDYRDQDLNQLKSRGVSVDGLTVKEGKTFRWAGRYEGDMNEAITLKTELNVFEHFSPELPEPYKKIPYVFLGNIDPELQSDVLDQMGNPKVVGLDTMNYWIDSKVKQLQSVLQRIDVLLINETEARKFSGEHNIVKAIQALAEMGPKAIVVKRGEYGFVLCAEGRFFVLPAFPVKEVVDPTGAGDCFAGGFFGYLAQQKGDLSLSSLKMACVHGTIVASFAVEDFSVRNLETLDATKIQNRLKDYQQVISL